MNDNLLIDGLPHTIGQRNFFLPTMKSQSKLSEVATSHLEKSIKSR